MSAAGSNQQLLDAADEQRFLNDCNSYMKRRQKVTANASNVHVLTLNIKDTLAKIVPLVKLLSSKEDFDKLRDLHTMTVALKNTAEDFNSALEVNLLQGWQVYQNRERAFQSARQAMFEASEAYKSRTGTLRLKLFDKKMIVSGTLALFGIVSLASTSSPKAVSAAAFTMAFLPLIYKINQTNRSLADAQQLFKLTEKLDGLLNQLIDKLGELQAV